MKNEIQIEEVLAENRALKVNEETSKLTKVLMWGAPGSETVLGQLLPSKISCFETQFDVIGARTEFETAKSILTSQGVEVIQVKDLMAKMIDEQGLKPEGNFEELRKNIETRALGYSEKYKGQGISDVEEVLSWLDEVLEADAKKYGTETATLMNEVLSLKSELPLSNVLYARDQSNLLGRTFVWSSMRHQIRQPEVHLFKTVLNHSGILESKGLQQVQINGGGRFEGGDGIANAGIFYIGVGGRSNTEGVLQASESIISKGGRVMISIDSDRDSGANEMDAMHLDTFWMPVGINQVVACKDEINRRQVLEVVGNPLSGLRLEDRGNFANHLEQRNVELIPLTKEEQLAYAPNFLNLGNKTVVLSLADGNNLTGELEKRGFTVFNANLKNITKGYGGLHCMTAAIKRE